MSIWLLARNSESLRGPDAANASVVRNSESLRGLRCWSVVYGSYGFIVPGSCSGVSLTVAMALSCQIAVRAYR